MTMFKPGDLCTPTTSACLMLPTRYHIGDACRVIKVHAVPADCQRAVGHSQWLTLVIVRTGETRDKVSGMLMLKQEQ